MVVSDPLSLILVTFYLKLKEYFPEDFSYISCMGKIHIAEVFAKNLERAIAEKYPRKPDGTVNQSAFAKDADLNQKSLSNWLSAIKPENKPHLDSITSPSLINIAKIADALQIEPWELLHADPVKARREQEFYRRIEQDFMKLPGVQKNEPEPYRWQVQGDRRHAPNDPERDQFGGVKLGESQQVRRSGVKGKKQD
jgi:hypothetical protein